MTDDMLNARSPQPLVAPARTTKGLAPLVGGVLVALLLVAGATLWLGPLVLVGAALLACGGLAGAGLVQWQVRAGVTRLLTATRGRVGQRPVLAGDTSGSLSTPSAAASMALLQPLSQGLHQLLARQEVLFQAQAAQLEALRQQAHCDGLTGLPNRRHFMATLDALLTAEGSPAEVGLLLVRVCDLQGMNQRIGHMAADHVLQALAQSLQTYTERIERCSAGRLTGADFALLLPVGGMAAETAQALVQALRGPISRIDPGAKVAAGGVELRSPMGGAQALALADAALAEAERTGSAPPLARVDTAAEAEPALPGGEVSWQRHIARALVQGRVALGAFAVRTADGRQLHLDCPLRVQLLPDGPLEPASRWLSLATRSRLCAAADERALALALEAIARDGVARCVNIAAQSVGSAEFVTAVSRRLEAEPSLACRLWIDLPEALALERPLLVRELSRRWRPLGVMLGLEHAGEGLARIPQLMDLGLDCVRIDGRFVNGIAGPDAEPARRYLQGLITLVQTVGLQVTAEGVRSADDLALLWGMGFDAATGPALVNEPVLPA
jgi:diguanylate cyclase (GGDEF)-like protein